MRLSSLSSRLLAVIAAAATLPTCLGAAQTLYTNSVSSCSPLAGTGAVNLTQLNLVYHRSNQSIVFSFALNTQETGLTLSANLYGEAYGNQIVNDTIDLCSLIGGVLCPLPQLDLAGVGTYTLPSQYTSQIPGLAWTVPNLDAFARLEAMFPNGTQAACVQMTFSNGLTTEHLGVKLASGLFTLVALLVGFAHSVALVSPSPAQYRWLDVLLLFQTAAATGLLRLDYPLNYLAFTHNFWWALGLFSNGNVEASINKMRYRTGGYLSGSAYPGVEYINRKMTGEYTNINELIDQLTAIARFLPGASSIFGRRSMSQAVAAPLARREVIASPVLTALSSSVDVGIPQYVNTEGIPTANAFDTIFFWFLAFIAIVIAVHVILGIVVWACSKSDQEWAVRLKRSFGSFFMGNLLLTCVFWFLPIWIFGFYQFKIGDSRLSIAFAALAIAATALPLLIAFGLSLFRSRRSQRTAPITYSYAKEDTTSRLYTSPRWYHSVGALYRPYRQKFHWFWFVLVLALLIRSAFIAFPSDPWRQVIGNVVLEFIVLILLIAFRPHKDKKGDWLAPFLSFCRLAAFGLLIAFIPSVGTAGIPKAIIGFVIIALFGVPTVLLFLGLIFNAFYGILWRRRTLKVEDGLEVRRYPSDDDASRTPMQQQRFGPNTRASLAPPAAGQRRSVFEPNATGNAYEPSAASNRYSAASGGYASNRHSSQYGYNPDQLTPPAGSRPSSRASRGTGATQYYTPQGVAAGDHSNQEYFRDGRY